MQRFFNLIKSIKFLRTIQLRDRITRKFRKFRFYKKINHMGARCNLSEKMYKDSQILIDSTHLKFGTFWVELEGIGEKYHDKSDLLLLYKLNYLDHLNSISLSDSQRYDILNNWISKSKDLNCPTWDPFPSSVRAVNILRLGSYKNYESILWLHYLIIDQFIEKHLLANHYLTNLKALYILSQLFNTSKKNVFRDDLIKQLHEQFAIDGVYYEQSTGYQRQLHLDLLDLFNFSSSGDYYDATLSNICLKLIQKSDDFLNEINDDTVFNDFLSDFSPTKEDLRCYQKKLLGSNDKIDVSREKLRHFPVSKFTFAEKRDVRVACSAGKILCNYNPGHQHANFASIEIWINRKKIITNSVSSTYATNAQRLRERGASYNNSLLINGREIYKIFDSFKLANRPVVEQDAAKLNDFFLIQNSLIMNNFPWIRKRKINRDLALYCDGLRICDSSSRKSDIVNSYFNLMPGFNIEKENDNILFISDGELAFELIFDGHFFEDTIDIGVGYKRTQLTKQLCFTGYGYVSVSIKIKGEKIEYSCRE